MLPNPSPCVAADATKEEAEDDTVAADVADECAPFGRDDAAAVFAEKHGRGLDVAAGEAVGKAEGDGHDVIGGAKFGVVEQEESCDDHTRAQQRRRQQLRTARAA